MDHLYHVLLSLGPDSCLEIIGPDPEVLSGVAPVLSIEIRQRYGWSLEQIRADGLQIC